MDIYNSPELWQAPEGQAYLNAFQELEPERFAVIKVGGSLIEDQAQLKFIGDDIATLRSLGLYPVVVHGAGPQIDEALAQDGFDSSKKDGVRITKPEHMPAVSLAMFSANQCLADDIGIAVEELTPGASSMEVEGVFSATLENPNDLGSIKEIVDIDIDRVLECIRYDEIPVISSLGRLATEKEFTPVNINADVAAAALAKVLKPRKFISLTETGAVLNSDGSPISELSIKAAREAIALGLIGGGMRVKVEQGLKIVESGVHDFVITNPQSLLRELFTSEGSGTLITNED